jgi:maltoporin
MYRRPEFRVIYTASWLNADARNLFPQFDERRDRTWQHYVGVQVEWWLDSSSYP